MIEELRSDLRQVLVGTRLKVDSPAPGIAGVAEVVDITFFGRLESSARYVNMWSAVCRIGRYEFGLALGKAISLVILTPIFEKYGLEIEDAD